MRQARGQVRGPAPVVRIPQRGQAPVAQAPKFKYGGKKEMSWPEVDLNQVFVSSWIDGRKGSRTNVFYTMEHRYRLVISEPDLYTEWGIGHSSEAADTDQNGDESAGEYTVGVGPNGVLYDSATNTFSNISGKDAEFYAFCLRLQARIEEQVRANPPPGVEHVNFYRMIRCTKAGRIDKTKEHNYLRLKFLTKKDDGEDAEGEDDGSQNIFTNFFDIGLKPIKNNFEFVRSRSRKSTVHLVFCVASVFVNNNNVASISCRINEWHFKYHGTDPRVKAEYIPTQEQLRKRNFTWDPNYVPPPVDENVYSQAEATQAPPPSSSSAAQSAEDGAQGDQGDRPKRARNSDEDGAGAGAQDEQTDEQENEMIAAMLQAVENRSSR